MLPWQITPVACLEDNYAYLLRCTRTGAVAVVDPSEPGPVVAALERAGLDLAMVLCTHHHHDHVGGVEGLRARYGAGLAVVGHESESARIPGMNRGVGEGAVVTLGELPLRVMHVPAHTLGAVAYHVALDGGPVFTGDTLFVAGCGRLFEGTAEMMQRAMEHFAGLPPATPVFPGHEYAEKNLRFAVAVEPGNRAAKEKFERVRGRRAAGEPCVPSTIADERETNPFMRTGAPEVQAFAASRGAGTDAVSVLAAVRRARDGF